MRAPVRMLVVPLLAASVACFAATPPARSGKEVVEARCANCHASGKGGAPRIGDREAWIERARQGLDTLVSSAIRGHGPMPARGGMAELTDPEMRAAVTYMVQTSLGQPPAK